MASRVKVYTEFLTEVRGVLQGVVCIYCSVCRLETVLDHYTGTVWLSSETGLISIE